ncbi:putative hemicentin-1 isoform X2 [Penaeus vannamei]|uniref:Putative hemicentin-1 isoform X2 n=1 Tax=Penaeus vannamei TaxID=6689 RepID=A0A3R7QYK8_PENVA|nr:hemicentin-1-like [Penaeus vannamei]ROT83517.1 putative hemicentin-1 isoform X2 [Penaeus vannamei]
MALLPGLPDPTLEPVRRPHFRETRVKRTSLLMLLLMVMAGGSGGVRDGHIDECAEQISGCHFTQTCSNTWGSYHCTCPRGFSSSGPGQPCLDVNECTLPERCQHRCENTIGSFMCLCPPGYRLNANRRTCDDINECREQDVQCGRDQLCFNLRGSYKCVSAPCPPEYQRDPATGSCILDCRWGKNNCPPGVTYAHILAFKTASLPAGIQAYQDLVRLMAYDQHGSLVPQTLFSIIENETGVAFRIRLEGGKGILSTLDPLAAGREYRMVVEAVSYDEVEHFIKYSTRFIIFLHISQYPY